MNWLAETVAAASTATTIANVAISHIRRSQPLEKSGNTDVGIPTFSGNGGLPCGRSTAMVINSLETLSVDVVETAPESLVIGQA